MTRRATIMLLGIVVVVGAVALWAARTHRSPILLGAVISESGPAAEYGKAVKMGIDLAYDEALRQGGFPEGRGLVLSYRDDGGRPDASLVAAKDLVGTSKANLLLGGLTSGVAQSVIPFLVEKEVVMISPSASAPALTAQGGGWFFRVYPNDAAETQQIGAVVQQLGLREVAVLAYNETFGRSLAELFAAQMTADGVKVALQESFDAPLAADRAKELAKKVVAAKVRAVYVAGLVNEVAALCQALDAERFDGVKLASSAVTSDIVKLAGPAAERLIFPQAAFELEGSAPKIKSFADAFQRKYNRAPGVYAAYGYDAMQAMVAALRKTQRGTAGEVRTQLVSLALDGVTGKLAFDNRGDVRRVPHLTAVVKGDLHQFDKLDAALRAALLP
ncbi:branched-chain amino acid ABC transporter substrate-binding protein [bacterium]|nr:branched-chain amino acid ABC transporter substrate-binding protein [bacterium]